MKYINCRDIYLLNQIEQWPGFKVMGVAQKIKTERVFEIIPKIW